MRDEYAHDFLPTGEQIAKRYPIINRGTYVRTTAIDQLVTRFLRTEPGQRKQIVSLGAGSDTRFWRLCGSTDEPCPNVVYHELDFESNATQKRAKIRHSPPFVEATTRAEKAGSTYHLHALDLRDLTTKSPPIIPDMDTTLPTLLLSECCLCYLPPETATSVLQYFAMHFAPTTPLALVVYEPIRPFDAFGKTMVSNLASRAIHLQTLKRYSSPEAQRQRMRMAGFGDGQGARDVFQLYGSEEWVSGAERERVERLEWLDEVEEWKLLASHYCVAWGWRGDVFKEAWSGLNGAMMSEEGVERG